MKPIRHIARASVGICAAVAALVGVAATPAHAHVTYVWAGAQVQLVRDHRVTPTVTYVDLYYSAYVTMDNAQLHFDYSGATISLKCYGWSPARGTNVLLFQTTHTRSSAYPLYVLSDGIGVNAYFSRPKGTLFDVNKAGIDEIWCHANYWETIPYYTTQLSASTMIVSGYF